MSSSNINSGNSGYNWNVSELSKRLEAALKEVSGSGEERYTKIFMYVDKQGQLQFEKKQSFFNKFLQVRRLKQTDGFLIQSDNKSGLLAQLQNVSISDGDEKEKESFLENIKKILTHIEKKREPKGDQTKVVSAALKAIKSLKEQFEKLFEAKHAYKQVSGSSTTEQQTQAVFNASTSSKKMEEVSIDDTSKNDEDLPSSREVNEAIDNSDHLKNLDNVPPISSDVIVNSATPESPPVVSSEILLGSEKVGDMEGSEASLKPFKNNPSPVESELKSSQEAELIISIFAPEETGKESITQQEAEAKLREVFSNSEAPISELVGKYNQIVNTMENLTKEIQEEKLKKDPSDTIVTQDEIMEKLTGEKDEEKLRARIENLSTVTSVLGSDLKVNNKASLPLLQRIAKMLVSNISSKAEEVKKLKQYTIRLEADNSGQQTQLEESRKELMILVGTFRDKLSYSPISSLTDKITNLLKESIDFSTSAEALSRIKASFNKLEVVVERVIDLDQNFKKVQSELKSSSLYNDVRVLVEKKQEIFNKTLSSISFNTIDECIQSIKLENFDLSDIERSLARAKTEERIYEEKEGSLEQLRLFIDSVDTNSDKKSGDAFISQYLKFRKKELDATYERVSRDVNINSTEISKLTEKYVGEINEAKSLIDVAQETVSNLLENKYFIEIKKSFNEEKEGYLAKLKDGEVIHHPFAKTESLLKEIEKHYVLLEDLSKKNMQYQTHVQSFDSLEMLHKDTVKIVKERFQVLIEVNSEKYTEDGLKDLSAAVSIIETADECAQLLTQFAQEINNLDKTVKVGNYKKNLTKFLSELKDKDNLEETKKNIQIDLENLKKVRMQGLNTTQKAETYKQEFEKYIATSLSSVDEEIPEEKVREALSTFIKDIHSKQITPIIEKASDTQVISFYENQFDAFKEKIEKQLSYARTALNTLEEFKNLQGDNSKVKDVRNKFFQEVADTITEGKEISKFGSSKAFQKILLVGDFEIAKDNLVTKINSNNHQGHFISEYRSTLLHLMSNIKDKKSLDEIEHFFDATQEKVSVYDAKIEKATTVLASLRNMSKIPLELLEHMQSTQEDFSSQKQTAIKKAESGTVSNFLEELEVFDRLIDSVSFMEMSYPQIASINSQQVKEFAALLLKNGVPFSNTLLQHQKALEQFFIALSDESTLQFEHPNSDGILADDVIQQMRSNLETAVLNPFNRLKELYATIKTNIENNNTQIAVELGELEITLSQFRVLDKKSELSNKLEKQYEKECLSLIQTALSGIRNCQNLAIFDDFKDIFEEITSLSFNDISSAREKIDNLLEIAPIDYPSWNAAIQNIEKSWKATYQIFASETNPFAKENTMASFIVKNSLNPAFDRIAEDIDNVVISEDKKEITQLVDITQFLMKLSADLEEVRVLYSTLSEVIKITQGYVNWSVKAFGDIIAQDEKKSWINLVSLQYEQLVDVLQMQFSKEEGVFNRLKDDLHHLFDQEIGKDIHTKAVEIIKGVFEAQLKEKVICDIYGDTIDSTDLNFETLLLSISLEFPYEKGQ